MKATTFETGNIYRMNFIVDSDLKVDYICVKRTEKTATFERFQRPSESLTRKIKVYNNVEYVLDGSYSMAPSIYADKIVG